MNTRMTPDAASLLERGIAASKEGDPATALALFKEAWSASPGEPAGPFLAASELAALGNAREAEELFAATVLLDPAFSLARYQLGLQQWTGHRIAMAFLTWSPLRANGDSAYAAFVQGFTALAAGNAASATLEFSRGLALPDCNPGVADDIRGLLTSPDLQESRHGSGPAEPTHVLLAAYAKAPHLH